MSERRSLIFAASIFLVGALCGVLLEVQPYVLVLIMIILFMSPETTRFFVEVIYTAIIEVLSRKIANTFEDEDSGIHIRDSVVVIIQH